MLLQQCGCQTGTIPHNGRLHCISSFGTSSFEPTNIPSTMLLLFTTRKKEFYGFVFLFLSLFATKTSYSLHSAYFACSTKQDKSHGKKWNECGWNHCVVKFNHCSISIILFMWNRLQFISWCNKMMLLHTPHPHLRVYTFSTLMNIVSFNYWLFYWKIVQINFFWSSFGMNYSGILWHLIDSLGKSELLVVHQCYQ